MVRVRVRVRVRVSVRVRVRVRVSLGFPCLVMVLYSDHMYPMLVL